MTPQIRTAEVSAGVTLEYVEQGEPAGMPLLLLHGGFDSWHSYERVLPHLPGGIRTFALTLRGQGASSKPVTGYRPNEMASDVAGFLDAVGLDAAIIVGHSSTSLVVQRFALDHPERTLGIVLIGGFMSMRDNPLAQEVHEAASELSDPVDPAFVREFQEATVAKPVPDGFLETIVRESSVPAHVWRELSAGVLAEDCAAELRKIAAPTLLIWGDADAASPRSQQEALVGSIPQSRLVVYSGAGHSLHWEEPERLAGDLVEFAQDLRVAAPA